MNDFFIADEERVIAPEYISDDNEIETSLRPHTLEEYIGQEKAKENLKIYIEAAKNRHESLGHVLLYGPPGLGKTTLAGIVANEMGVQIRVTSGPAIEKPGDLAALLTSFLDKNGCGGCLCYKGEGTIGIYCNNNRDNKTHIVLSTLIKFLCKRHNVYAVLTKRRSNRRSRCCFSGRDLELYEARNFLSH